MGARLDSARAGALVALLDTDNSSTPNALAPALAPAPAPVCDERYEGELANSVPHGRGTHYFASGATFEGFWENGLREGAGKYTFTTGAVEESVSGDGAWKNGVEEGLFVWTSGKKTKPRVIEEREYVGGVCMLRTVVKKKRKKAAAKKQKKETAQAVDGNAIIDAAEASADALALADELAAVGGAGEGNDSEELPLED